MDEPHQSEDVLPSFLLQYIGLATRILHFLNSHFMNTNSNEVREYLKNSLSESHMSQLALVIKDLDKEQPKTPDCKFHRDTR